MATKYAMTPEDIEEFLSRELAQREAETARRIERIEHARSVEAYRLSRCTPEL